MTDTTDKIDFHRSTARDYKCNFVLGSSPNEYVSVSNKDYQIDDQTNNFNQNVIQSSKEKGKNFRKHNYIVGYSKPEYQSLSSSVFCGTEKSDQAKGDIIAAEKERKESRKSHFSFGNDNQSPLESHKPGMLSEFGKHLQSIETHQKQNNEAKQNIKEHKKQAISLARKQNIVYGYEKLSPYCTSNNFYKSSNPNAFPKHISSEVDQKLRKASFGFGNNDPEYYTSNKMQLIKIKKDENIDKCVGSTKNSPKVNKSHFRISQINNSMLGNSTTYTDSICANAPSSCDHRDPNDFKRHKDVSSSIVLGFQKHEMVSETKDKFVKLTPKSKEYHRYSNVSHINSLTPSMTAKNCSRVDRYTTTEEIFRTSAKTPNMSCENKNMLNTAASLEHKINSQSTHFSIGYSQQSKAEPGYSRYSNKVSSHNKFRQTAAYKPSIGNFGIDNFQLANKSLRKVNNSFATTNMEYSWIKPVQNG